MPLAETRCFSSAQISTMQLQPCSQDKKNTDDHNQNIFQKIPLQLIPFWPKPRIEKCHFLSFKLSTLCYALLRSATLCYALLRSDELYCPFDQSAVAVAGAANAANARQWEAITVSLFSPPLHPCAMNPTATTHGHFVLFPVSLAMRDQDGGPSNSTIGIYDLTGK